MTRNILFEQARSARGRESLAQELRAWIQPEDEVAGDPAELVSERASLRTALTKLSDSDRELLTLIAWQGLTQAEAALVVGCSSATFAVRLHRARRRLEQALDDSSGPAEARPPEGRHLMNDHDTLMDALAQARPVRLDPDTDPALREQEAARSSARQ